MYSQPGLAPPAATGAAMPIISLEGVSKSYPAGREQAVVAVRGVSLAIQKSEFVVITGRSGSGKTTLLNLAAGLTRPTSGAVALRGYSLWSMKDEDRARLRNRTVGFVFQFPSLIPSLTVLENVTLPTAFGNEEARDGARERAVALLADVGLSDKICAYPRQLSAGQQQRVVIARATINRPQIIFADEPTSNLDEQTEQEIMELFAHLHSTGNVTILLVTHSSQLTSYGTRSLRMSRGELAEPDAR